nr:hypothetical protein Iba_scaffold47250CG0140 [Ipomoea batatas]
MGEVNLEMASLIYRIGTETLVDLGQVIFNQIVELSGAKGSQESPDAQLPIQIDLMTKQVLKTNIYDLNNAIAVMIRRRDMDTRLLNEILQKRIAEG